MFNVLIGGKRFKFGIHATKQCALNQVDASLGTSQRIVAAGKARQALVLCCVNQKYAAGQTELGKIRARCVALSTQPEAVINHGIQALFGKLCRDREQIVQAFHRCSVVRRTQTAVKQGQHHLVARKDDRSLGLQARGKRGFARGDFTA